MALPDVVLKIMSAPTPLSIPTATDTAYRAVYTERGWAKKPRMIRSMVDFVNYFGARLTTADAYDWAEAFFQEGGSELMLSRTIAANATVSSIEVGTSGKPKLLKLEAGSMGEPDPGKWSAAMKVVVEVVASTFRIKVELGGAVVEESPYVASPEAFVSWAQGNSLYLKATLGVESGANPEAKATTTVTTLGTDGTAVADADYKLALERIGREYGPGQVSVEGTTSARGLMLLEHAQANNRFALVDGANTETVATLISAAQALYAAPNNGRRYGQLLAPWDVVPGLTPLSARQVPPSARLAAQYAKVDAEGNPNRAAAGRRGIAVYATDLSQPSWTNVQREELNNAGVTVSRRRFGVGISTWGFRTLADQNLDSEWSMAPNIRCLMAFSARAEAAMEPFEFDQVDGFGSTLSKAVGALTTIAQDFHKKGALYGKVPQEAYAINAEASLNPPAKLAKGEVTVEADLHISPGAEMWTVRIVKVPITQAV